MKKKQLIAELIKLFKGSLKSGSMFYAEDLADFRAGVSKETIPQLEQHLVNMQCLAGQNKNFNRKIDLYEKKLSDAGMYDMKKMKPENALD